MSKHPFVVSIRAQCYPVQGVGSPRLQFSKSAHLEETQNTIKRGQHDCDWNRLSGVCVPFVSFLPCMSLVPVLTFLMCAIFGVCVVLLRLDCPSDAHWDYAGRWHVCCQGPMSNPRPVLDSPARTTRDMYFDFFFESQNELVCPFLMVLAVLAKKKIILWW